MTDVLLVRHGRTEWNQVGRLQGHEDIPLDDVGTAQAAAVRRGATAQFRRSGNSIYVTVSRTSTQLDTLLRPFPLDANQHVAFLTATSDSVLFNSRGTAQNLGISGAKFVMYREGIKDSVCVTKLGSILDRSCAL